MEQQHTLEPRADALPSIASNFYVRCRSVSNMYLRESYPELPEAIAVYSSAVIDTRRPSPNRVSARERGNPPTESCSGLQGINPQID
eukprot:scaffold31_cov263-Pinguiococcus_pyrenoidosus.AAC.56